MHSSRQSTSSRCSSTGHRCSGGSSTPHPLLGKCLEQLHWFSVSAGAYGAPDNIKRLLLETQPKFSVLEGSSFLEVVMAE